jgi:glycosyltransferase involved in cell wall biosynthesis
MKVSIITVVLNNRDYVEECIRSVVAQGYSDIEHIIIDGGSTDGTVDAIRKCNGKISQFISEPDKGIYDALNKGIKISTGEVIGILHSDDFYEHHRVIERVVNVFERENLDSCYGDLYYVNKADPKKIVRYWKSSPYRLGQFRSGWMPPHCAFFAKRSVYEKHGLFRTDFKIAADYELMLRFLEIHKISTYHIDDVFIRMRLGGTSNRSLRNIIKKSYEDYRAWKVNGLSGGLLSVFLKNVSKLPQLMAYFKQGNQIIH